MSPAEARAALKAAMTAIHTAVLTLRGHVALIEAFQAEARLMESAGPVLHPTLFNDPERRETAALIGPVLEAARNFVKVFDALSEVAFAAMTRRPEADR